MSGRRSPSTRYRRTSDSRIVPLPPDPAEPYYGPGYRLDNPDHTGDCAACHVPAAAINDPLNTDPFSVQGAEAEGVTCDFCHKIWDVRLNPATGFLFPKDPECFPTNSGDLSKSISSLPGRWTTSPRARIHIPSFRRAASSAPHAILEFFGIRLFTIPSGSGCAALTAGRRRERHARIAICRARGPNSLSALKRAVLNVIPILSSATGCLGPETLTFSGTRCL